MYEITVQLIDCDDPDIETRNGAGQYTGWATSRSGTTEDDVLVLIVTSGNGQYAMGQDFQ